MAMRDIVLDFRVHYRVDQMVGLDGVDLRANAARTQLQELRKSPTAGVGLQTVEFLGFHTTEELDAKRAAQLDVREDVNIALSVLDRLYRRLPRLDDVGAKL